MARKKKSVPVKERAEVFVKRVKYLCKKYSLDAVIGIDPACGSTGVAIFEGAMQGAWAGSPLNFGTFLPYKKGREIGLAIIERNPKSGPNFIAANALANAFETWFKKRDFPVVKVETDVWRWLAFGQKVSAEWSKQACMQHAKTESHDAGEAFCMAELGWRILNDKPLPFMEVE